LKYISKGSPKIWYVTPELLIFLIILKLIKFWVWVTKPNVKSSFRTNFMFVFKKCDRQNHVWSFMMKYLLSLCKFTSWSGEILCSISKNLLLWNHRQHRIGFSIQPQLQLVNLHRNLRYFVIKLHTWFVYHISWRQT
jgi:hypothetical protein